VLILGLVVGACGLLTFAAIASAHRSYVNEMEHDAASVLPCDSYFSTPDISPLTGTAMGPNPYTHRIVEAWKAGTDNSMWSIVTTSPRSTIAGSECTWSDKGGAGLGDGDSLQAWVAVGYDELQEDWGEMWAHGGPAFTSEEGALKATTRVNVGYGSQAYLQTFDLWEVTAQSYFVPPKYLYALTVMTKNHDLLVLAPGTATRGSVEAAVEHILKTHPSF